MGYVHDTGMVQFIPPTVMHGDTAAWAMAAGAVSNSMVYGADATDEVANLWIPVVVPSNAASMKGACLSSVEVDYQILTAACDAVTATIYKYTRGGDGEAVTVESVSFSYDSGHDSAAERYDVDQHEMTLTLDDEAWIDEDDFYWVKIAFDKAATSTVEILGAFAHFTLRV